MMTLLGSLCGLAFVNIFIMLGIAFADDMHGVGFSFINPRVIYDAISVNRFGAILIAVFLHILLPVIAALYWLYKLCTVGRK